jgi:hypothetical protein
VMRGGVVVSKSFVLSSLIDSSAKTNRTVGDVSFLKISIEKGNFYS